MGSFVSYLWWGFQNPDEADPTSGLTLRDVYYVRKSWSKVSADGVASGTELLVRYFTAFPETKAYFKSFKNVPINELKANRQFQAHCLNIVTSLTALVENLHKPELIVTMCEKIGSNHKNHKITTKNFNDIKGVLIKLFKDMNFDDATLESWGKASKFLFTNIFTTLE